MGGSKDQENAVDAAVSALLWSALLAIDRLGVREMEGPIMTSTSPEKEAGTPIAVMRPTRTTPKFHERIDLGIDITTDLNSTDMRKRPEPSCEYKS